MDRVLMNLHPGILDNAAFLERPRSLAELYRTIGLNEEKISVSKEREQMELDTRARRGGRVEPREATHPTRRNQDRPGTWPVTLDLWPTRAIPEKLPQGTDPSGNRQRPAGLMVPGPGS